MKKYCKRCDTEKHISEFHRHKGMPDGHQSYCKPCRNSYFKAYRDEFHDEHLAKSRKYREKNAETISARLAAWKKSQADWAAMRKQYRERYKDLNPKKTAAHLAVYAAVRRGRIKRMPCEVCGSTENVHAHHDDYSKPLSVRWLCPADHREWHMKHGEARNG